jgi:3-deoxy-D-manno-octulosonate 8-phosphate phosphatase (KDO 8-P phosphatase)
VEYHNHTYQEYRLSSLSTRLLNSFHLERLRSIKSLILDVDGVLTDDTVFIGPEGYELKRFNISDGLGLALMRDRLKIKVAVVSGRHSEATSSRCGELRISPIIQGEPDKRAGVRKVLKAHNVSAEYAAFVGNEILDIAAFSQVGFKIAVADAAPELASRADLVLRRGGGQGVVRELFELICRARGVDYVSWFA